MKVAVVGSGYVGLTTALSFCYHKHKVLVHDINKNKVDKLKNGIPTFYESGLENLLKKQIQKKNIFFTSSFSEMFNFSKIIFVCVGTPSIKNGNANLEQITNILKIAKKEIHKENNIKKIIVIKSTVPPKTTENFDKNFGKRNLSSQLYFASNPEFLREGSALSDSLNPDRVVIGCKENFVKKELNKLYKNFKTKNFFTNFKTAEMAKYCSNYLLACLISASNEIANLSKNLRNIDFDLLLDTIKEDRRWNTKDKANPYPKIHNYLIPGPGFGGSCFSKDLKALNYLNNQHRNPNSINKAILKTNSLQYLQLIKELKKIKTIKKNKKILILGLSFKENTSDIRESRTIPLVDYLKNRIRIFLYKDLGFNNFKHKVPESKTIKYIDKIHKIKFDTVIIMNRDRKFTKIIKKTLKINPKCNIFDTRGLIKINDYMKIKNYFRY